MPITGKTYLPGFALRLSETCDFVTKYGARIIEVTTVLAPTEVVAMTTLIASIQAGCLLVESIHKLYDPDFGDTLADNP